ncbi:MAG: hypothetical protein KME30_20525 [Iphinoe sp. HA4291-MV1]|nr:hypothetical protein [Iphinoe sp. HA4291-MV1]
MSPARYTDVSSLSVAQTLRVASRLRRIYRRRLATEAASVGGDTREGRQDLGI